ncbi:MAG: hypothetical protein JJV99_03915 [Colwellia sp.]|nr:hypothetical protein [Colwellia sp.]
MSFEMLLDGREIQSIDTILELDVKNANMRRLKCLLESKTFISITWINTNNAIRNEYAGGSSQFNECSFEANIVFDGFVKPIQISDRFSDIGIFYEAVHAAFDISANNNVGLSSAFKQGLQNLKKWCVLNKGKDINKLGLFEFDYRLIACIPYKN